MAGAEWIPLRRAVAKYQEYVGRDALFTVLTYLIRDGAIETHIEPEDGDLWVLETQVQTTAAYLDRRQWEALKGQQVSLLEAAEKHNIPTPTFLRWMERGYLREIGSDGFRRFLDAAEATFVGAMWSLVGKPGRAIFPLLSMDGDLGAAPRETAD